MKKIAILFIIAAFCFAAAVSCEKETNVPAEEQQEEVVTPEEPVVPGEDENLPEGMIRLTFTLSSENGAPAGAADAPQSRTSWDGSTQSWSEGDKIRIMWNAGTNETHVENTDYVDVEVVGGKVSAVVADADYYYAVYSTDAAYELSKGSEEDLSDATMSVSFGRDQAGTFKAANIMVAKTTKAAASFAFKNMTGILKFSTASESPYTHIDFAANDKTKFNGTVSTTFPSTFAVSTTPGGSYADMLSADIAADGTYYLAVLPDAELASGIGYKVTKDGSQSTGALSTGALTLGRSAIQDLQTIDDNIHTEWFITETGTGKGTSWEDAGGPERLVQLIYPTQSRGSGQGLTAAWRLHRATIYVAAGTYNIQAANGDEVLAPHYNTGTLTATIKGGYPNGLSGTATTDQDPETNQTKFICNQTANTDRVFLLSGSNKIPNITFDGITFPANGPSLAPGTAFDFNSSAASNITFNNCTFSGFVQSGTVNGGPIHVQNSGAAKISFTDCTFSGNQCNTGGAIYLNNANAAVSFTDCTVNNNSSRSHGGALRARDFATLTITGGSFTDNSTTGTSTKGAAIYVDGGTELTIDGTSFINNSATGRAGALLLISSATAEIKNADFTKNNASNGGAIHTEDNANLFVNNCTFSGNTATNGGAIRIAGAENKLSKVVVFNSLFDGNKGSGSSNGGGTINADIYGRAYIANSTIRKHDGHSAISISNGAAGTYTYIYAVSCTFAENTAEFTRNYNYMYFINSIATNGISNGNPGKDYSILGDTRYGSAKKVEATVSGLGAACLKTFDTDHYPLSSDVAYSDYYSKGVSVADLQGWTLNNISLTDEQKALLAKDQKGNDREGKIMGAYVLTE